VGVIRASLIDSPNTLAHFCRSAMVSVGFKKSFPLSWKNYVVVAFMFVVLLTQLRASALAKIPNFVHVFTTASTLNCERTIRLGDDYGGWVLCTPLGATFHGQLVYTIGIGRNIEWDKAMIKHYGTVHHGWDPTPTAVDFFTKKQIPDGFHFHKTGLGPTDGNLTLKLPEGNHDSYTVMDYQNSAQEGTITTVPILTVDSMMKRLGHRHLAILKIDIEGAEFAVIDEWVRLQYNIPADQVLIEFHERYFSHEREHKNLVPQAILQMSGLGFDLIVRTRLVSCTELFNGRGLFFSDVVQVPIF